MYGSIGNPQVSGERKRFLGHLDLCKSADACPPTACEHEGQHEFGECMEPENPENLVGGLLYILLILVGWLSILLEWLTI